MQAWELLDPPSGWDTAGPVLATGYYHINSTALQMVMLIDDAMAQACHQGGGQHQQWHAVRCARMHMCCTAHTQVPNPEPEHWISTAACSCPSPCMYLLVQIG